MHVQCTVHILLKDQVDSKLVCICTQYKYNIQDLLYMQVNCHYVMYTSISLSLSWIMG